MLTKVRRRLEQEEGFTLIELLVVILIIGILAAVAIPTFLSQKNKATDSNAQSNLKNAQTVVEAFANGNGGNYPASSFQTIGNALTGDSDAAALNSGAQAVYYSSAGGTNDTYDLCAAGSTNNGGNLWWIIVTNGATEYYDSAGTTCSGATVPSTGGSPSGFPIPTS